MSGLPGLLAWWLLPLPLAASTPSGPPAPPSEIERPCTAPLPQPDPSLTGPVWFLGCSFTNNAIAGYRHQGGQRFGNPIPGYGGGSVTAWDPGSPHSERLWRAFAGQSRASERPVEIWWQLCNDPGATPEDLERAARAVLGKLRELVPEARIVVSAQHRFAPPESCRGESGSTFRMERLVSKLVWDEKLAAGPYLGALERRETRDGCHANPEGQRKLGRQLLEFFR